MIAMNVRVDLSGLNSVIQMGKKFSKWTPPDEANTATYYIAVEAEREMPRVPIGRIDAELSVEVAIRIGKRGKPLSAKNSNNRFLTAARGGKSDVHNVPFAALIVMARSRYSRYNELTKFRWYMRQSPFVGVSREAGAMAMREAVHHMIAGGHSSIAFLASSLVPVIKELKPHAKGSQARQPAPPPMENAVMRGKPKGFVTIATAANPVCIISLEIGMEGYQAEKYNEALWRYGPPVIQTAVNNQTRFRLDYIESRFLKDVVEPARRLGAAR